MIAEPSTSTIEMGEIVKVIHCTVKIIDSGSERFLDCVETIAKMLKNSNTCRAICMKKGNPDQKNSYYSHSEIFYCSLVNLYRKIFSGPKIVGLSRFSKSSTIRKFHYRQISLYNIVSCRLSRAWLRLRVCTIGMLKHCAA